MTTAVVLAICASLIVIGLGVAAVSLRGSDHPDDTLPAGVEHTYELRWHPVTGVFDAVCGCGWLSETYGSDAGAQLAADRHVSTAPYGDTGLRILEPTRRWDEWVNEHEFVDSDPAPRLRRHR
jgi:hypothetical protein